MTSIAITITFCLHYASIRTDTWKAKHFGHIHYSLVPNCLGYFSTTVKVSWCRTVLVQSVLNVDSPVHLYLSTGKSLVDAGLGATSTADFYCSTQRAADRELTAESHLTSSSPCAFNFPLLESLTQQSLH